MREVATIIASIETVRRDQRIPSVVCAASHCALSLQVSKKSQHELKARGDFSFRTFSRWKMPDRRPKTQVPPVRGITPKWFRLGMESNSVAFCSPGHSMRNKNGREDISLPAARALPSVTPVIATAAGAEETPQDPTRNGGLDERPRGVANQTNPFPARVGGLVRFVSGLVWTTLRAREETEIKNDSDCDIRTCNGWPRLVLS
ncbi:hypothetical protein ZHAS_00015736 [Anopheles sinensis]|uniref:Uncharacterized protein n=1 Tax=Anopheles sinensis TaxID=74873 RepID=A0A084WBN4_ANOSI|nr:hypothetical protein ZHAS_00015736 [Anopheles sinensis]